MPAVLPLATIQRPPGRTIADGCRGRIGLIVSMFLLFATLFVPVAGAAEAPPQLFVYPPEYRYTDGGILNSPQTMTIDQITERVSDIPELSGVVLIVYWSTLCPAEIGCDFSLIDKAIEYWKKKQKKIILSVATIGFPIMQPPDRRSVIGASPDWVMKKIRTYSFTTRLLGNIPLNSTTNFVLPDFRDPEFLRLGGELIRNLALRYDGNPTIARVRIATGAMGEENPIVGPLSKPLAGYAERQWIDYCDAVITQYERAFKKSELEFDISRLPWVRAIGSPTNKALVDRLMARLARDRVMVAFDGLEFADDELVKLDATSTDGRAQALRYLKEHKRGGGRIGLEAFDHLANPRMGTADLNNVDRIARTVLGLAPQQLVMFNDVTRAVRDGITPALHAVELLRSVGVNPPAR